MFVSKLFPGEKVLSGTTFPFHHVNVVLQGLIHEVSSILQGSFRLVSIFVSSNPPTRSATEITRHGVRCGTVCLDLYLLLPEFWRELSHQSTLLLHQVHSRIVPYGRFGYGHCHPVVELECGGHLYQLFLATLENHLTSLCDTPKAYEGQPGFEVLRTVPGTWDEIRVPLARMNEHVTVARRSGSDWWVGSLNNGTERDLKLELDFLSEGDYQATIYTDAEDVERNPNNLDRLVRKVTRKDIIELNLARDGGALLHIRRL